MERSDPDLSAEAALASARARAVQRAAELMQGFDAVVESSREANLDDEHDPEGSTVGFERAQIQALLDSARVRLTELDAARERLERGVYGICESCGAPISTARLAAEPAARTCVDCAARPSAARRPT
ncbi:MAG: DnaK suppressor protein [Actinomycetota bacterium]|jgi:DnaK suppressor protein|nr:DnaK suppressor protein [Actinomycetota bacterium]